MSRFAFAGIITPFVVLGQQQQHHQQHHQQSALDAEVSIQERPQAIKNSYLRNSLNIFESHSRQLQGSCSNGISGVESDNGKYCCPPGCTACAGSDCGSFGTDCCASDIEDLCSSTRQAPCEIDDEGAGVGGSSTDSTCSNGFDGIESSNGQYCCTDDCSACGGKGCRGFGTSCCTGAIEETCTAKGSSPCIIDNASPTPVTPTPVVPTPTGVSPMPFTIPSPDYPMPVPSPTPIMTIPDTCTDSLPTIRYAQSSGVAGRMYMEGSGCGTMTDLYKTRVEKDGWIPKGPIYILDENNDIDYAPTAVTGKWLLAAELYIQSGAVFYCKGTDIDGDCDELRIQSTGSDDYHEVRGHGGSLYFENTVVTSWDTPNKQPQEDYEDGRSFLNCVSEFESDVTCEGEPKNDIGECRMDIINSEMGYMGYFASESYGLTWKVRGFCQDTSNPEVFDNTNVYGDIINSDIHHMYYGMYSYGHQGGVWTDNKMHDNIQYGFDPHDDSDYLTIARNEVYNNGNHGIIASKRCNNVEIYDNEVYDGGAQAAGIFLHRSTDSAEVYDNYVHDMQDAGIAILESSDSEIYNNRFVNVKYGIRISLGGGNNYVHNNTFDTCSQYGFFTYMGSDAPETTADGRPGENYFMDNEVLSTEMGVKIKEADNTVITGNTFTGTTELQFYDAQATIWTDNTIPSGTCLDIVDEDDGDNIPLSTFAEQSGLPVSC